MEGLNGFDDGLRGVWSRAGAGLARWRALLNRGGSAAVDATALQSCGGRLEQGHRDDAYYRI